jgi:RTX calcium-binding nonapeptide repeat (4 copies)
MAVAILLAGGVALAKNINCPNRDNRLCVGTNNADTMTGTNRSDMIKARGGADIVMARGGKDRVSGGDGGEESLDGGAGNDKINAGPNPVTELDGVAGGPGDEELVESPGADVYAFGTDWGQDEITGDGDQPGAPADLDRVCFACGTHLTTAGVTINLATGTATDGTNTVSWDATVPFIEIASGGFGGDNITGSTRFNIVHGSEGADTINVSGDPSSGGDSINCGDNDGDTDTVTKDSVDTIQGTSCDGDTVINVP